MTRTTNAARATGIACRKYLWLWESPPIRGHLLNLLDPQPQPIILDLVNEGKVLELERPEVLDAVWMLDLALDILH